MIEDCHQHLPFVEFRAAVPAFRGTLEAIPGTGVAWARRFRLGPDEIGLTSRRAQRLTAHPHAACVAGLG